MVDKNALLSEISSGAKYAEAVQVGDTIYVAGTVGFAADMSLPPDMEAQMRNAYRNIAKSLEHFGASMNDVVDQTVFVTDIDAAMSASHVRSEFFDPECPPASAMIEISRLGMPELTVEIKAIAKLSGRP